MVFTCFAGDLLTIPVRHRKGPKPNPNPNPYPNLTLRSFRWRTFAMPPPPH